MSAPSVYSAINAITGELAKTGIPKSHTNEVDDYKYRSIDDVLDKLAPLLSKHRLCILPRAVERTVIERSDEQDRLLLHVTLKVAFSLNSVDDGTSHIVEGYGEALDAGDKATAKAMSAAYKSAVVQAFCIPVSGADDPDRTGYRLSTRVHDPEPLQGWTQWCLDIEDIVSLCESEQAISTVQERNRNLLKSLAREQPQLYADLGQAFLSRRKALTRSKIRQRPARRSRATDAANKDPEVAEAEHA
jgi:hypothetical protein